MSRYRADIIAPGRREQRKAERRTSIIEVAMRCFLERGYGRTTMSMIAKEIGGSKGTLWSYFSSKEDLFAAVLETATAEFRQVLVSALDPTLDLSVALTMFCEKFIARITADDAVALQRLIVGEVARFPEIGRIFYDRAPGRSQEIMTEYLAGKMAEGVVQLDTPDNASGMLLALCSGGYHQRVVWGVEAVSATVAKREAARVVEHFLHRYARP